MLRGLNVDVTLAKGPNNKKKPNNIKEVREEELAN